jgi:hypothetical protein
LTLAEHLADGLVRYYKGSGYARFREQILIHWRQEYGADVESFVRKFIEGKV